ncbi:MAG: hypothetical protein HKN00_08225 [Flavobacteriaceae bacterium]|nr:hypothetical protein [Bacteroidia bacterium]NNF75152.1 hypothetical protein [Flavobacteriaceae bacterium]
MNNFKTIQNKLEEFIRRYYTNELIKGSLLFIGIGLLYLIFTLFIEYLLWLSSGWRTVLFWLFVLVEATLFIKFIALPLARLFKLRSGIDHEAASKIIGSHFPEVSDKLLNVLQLKSNNSETELLLASIEQKSTELKPIPFKLAINFRSNIKYIRYAAIPLIIIALSYVSGKFDWFSDSYERVVNYQTAYEPPAPFQFFLLNDDLQAVENKDFTLVVNTEGDVIPEAVQIIYNNETYYLKQIGPGQFEYLFNQPKTNTEFKLQANGVSSKPYILEVMEVPTLLSFDMILDYPAHTRKKDETLKSNGNATVPQGTRVTWKLKTKATEEVSMNTADTTLFFNPEERYFSLSRRLIRSMEYEIQTSNTNLKNYESLSFAIDVVRDEYPELNVQMQQDSIDNETLYFYGQVSDDYGLRGLQIVYYPANEEKNKKTQALQISNSTFDEFINIFPDQLTVQEGIPYQLYFEVFDNDAVNGYKRTKSNTFNFRKLTQDEKELNQLKEQNETIDDLNDALEKFEEQDERLKELSKTQKEKSELNFNDKKKLENFLQRQKEQEELMQNFNKKLKQNLDDFQNENEKDAFKESLKERLDENQKQLEQDEELLKELQKIADKINKEELSQKLEELAKQNKNQKRSLEQLLELTKRYYVAQKTEKLKNELEQLAKEQEKLADEESDKNTKEEQDKLNEKFEDFQKELEELRKDNEGLREPMQVPNDKKTEEDIKQEQQEASDNLEKKEQSQDEQQQNENQNNAKKNQKKAAQKMMQMAQQMAQQMNGSSGDQLSEDVDMLRQILDNLVLFSFDQEDLMERFRSIQVNHNEYPKNLRKQKSLREHFEHIDDSLFALSLRQPMISEKINKEITEVFFNIDKSLGQFSENRLYQGVAAQQYAVTSANSLASFLSDVLDNLEMQMNPSPGQGQGDMQLPDIIMSQQQLSEMMKEGMKKKGEQEGEKDGEKNKGDEGDPKEGDPKEGKEGQQEGEGENNNEELNGELFEIYKRQQELRNALEDKLGKSGESGEGKDLLRKMEEVELDLLNKGFTNRTLQKMMELQHQLLKLENATFMQGEDQKRQSKTNKEIFNNTVNDRTPDAKEYFNTTEILNRQALPLQQSYKKKVQEYFKKKNDQF